MIQITLNIPDKLILKLGSLESQIPEILELGIREINANYQGGFNGAADVLEFLASLPSPEEILALRPSEVLQNQIYVLLEKNRSGQLTLEEQKTWEQYQYLEHLVRLAKAKAFLKTQQIQDYCN